MRRDFSIGVESKLFFNTMTKSDYVTHTRTKSNIKFTKRAFNQGATPNGLRTYSF